VSLDLLVSQQFRSVVREEIRAALAEASRTDAPLTYCRAAEFLQCDVSTIGQWVKDGILPAHGRGKLRRVYRADLLKALGLSSAPKADPSPREMAEHILSGKKLTRVR
jgi:excisionase family DNA binding protein